MSAIANFRDLKIWQRSKLLVREFYRITAAFPREEMYGLASQIRRAAVSIPSNIAEGHARGTRKEYAQFLVVARGSLAEVETQLEIALDIGYIAQEEATAILTECEQLARMIRTLINKLKTPNTQPLIPNPNLGEVL